MNSGSVTTLGVSAGNGMIHCALVTVDDHGRLETDALVIDVDPTDRLDRAGRVNSGIDLMLDRARRSESPAGRMSVGAIGVACRTTRQGREIASRGVGPRRQIHLVGDAESVACALAASGEIAQHTSVVVVDCGDTGMTVFRLDTATAVVSDLVRSSAISGFDLDAALAGQVTAETEPIASRSASAALVSGCRTAKEDLSLGDSTTFQIAGVARRMSVAMLDSAIAPMAQRAAIEIVEYASNAHGRAPVPIVLVGGLANIPALQEILARETATYVIRPDSPELLCAVGAALLARSSAAPTSRLAFIGGRRQRDWLSAVPLAIVGSLLAGTMLTVYAVGTALTGASTSEVITPTTAPTSVVGRPAAQVGSTIATTPFDSETQSAPVRSTSVRATRAQPAPDPTPETAATIPSSVPTRPRWATTELPTTVPSEVPTSTITPEVTSSNSIAPTDTTPGTSGSPDPYSEPIGPESSGSPTHSLTPYPNPLNPMQVTPGAMPPETRTTAPVG